MKNHLIKLLTVSFSIIILFAFIACNNTEDNSDPQVSESEIKAEPPSIDIHTAALLGNTKAVKQHIKAGSDLDVKDQYGSSPLIIAITFDKTECATALIESGADINCLTNEESTPLHTAAFLCRKEIVELLLKEGADQTKKNIYGSTALESVSSPFKDVKEVYDQFSKDLGSLGLKLDYKYIEETRPVIAEMLK